MVSSRRGFPVVFTCGRLFEPSPGREQLSFSPTCRVYRSSSWSIDRVVGWFVCLCSDGSSRVNRQSTPLGLFLCLRDPVSLFPPALPVSLSGRGTLDEGVRSTPCVLVAPDPAYVVKSSNSASSKTAVSVRQEETCRIDSNYPRLTRTVI